MGSANDGAPGPIRPLVVSRRNIKGSKQTRTFDQPAGFKARAGALSALHAVLEQGRLLEESTIKGSPADRAEARGLADLTLRRLNQIDDVLSRFVDRSPKGNGHQILRLMAAELLFNQTSPHAAVDMAVRLAKTHRSTARLAGLINAVGRRLAQQGAAIVADQDAAAMALPDWLANRLSRDWGADITRGIAQAHLTPAPHDLTMKIAGDAEALAQDLSATILPTGSVRLKDRPQISALPGYEAGAWWIQDAAAALPVHMLPAGPGKRILDLCAAPGGKTMQLAASGASVTALDISDHRLRRVSENLKRTGLDAELIEADALDWSPQQPFDAILLDAPCSASGTIRRHPDLPHRRDHLDLNDLQRLQRALLDRSVDWLIPGGTLVFCTCSLFKPEGETLIDAVLASDKRLALDPLTAQDGIPAEMVTHQGYLRTRPDHWSELGHLDGFFAARLLRQ